MYYVKTRDSSGKEIMVEVSFDVYNLFEEERKREIRYKLEQRRHLGKQNLTKLYPTTETMEDQYLNKEQMRSIFKIIASLPPIQQKRFILHCFYGYTYREIAQIQHTSIIAIWKSVTVVKKFLKNMFQ